MMNIDQKVFDLVASHIEIDRDKLTLDSGLGITTNWDSLKHTTLIIELEVQFDVSFNFDELDKLVTIKAIIESLSNKAE